MCGIAGFTWRNEQLLRSMVHALHHRGPDESGTFVDERVSLGHTRLSVLDLTDTGCQPMSSDDGQAVIIYNGEIYNHIEVRDDLIRLGHQFRGSSDTEVFLRAYLEWGLDCLSRFNGMWAACIYDRRSNRLILTRDRIGVKPLYYAETSHGLIFASELKAILEHPLPRRVNLEAVDLLLSTQFIPSPMTIFEGIHKLEPRQYMTWDLEHSRKSLDFYYEIPQSRPRRDRDSLIREGRRLLEDAVRIRLVADVPVGAFLSGGIDSTTVVAEMRKWVDGDNLHTVSMGFEIAGLDESEYIRLAQAQFATKHHHCMFGTADIDRMADEVSRVYDEPVADTSSFPTLLLCQEARKWMTVALSGDGGDEIFGGYGGRQVAAQFETICRVPRILRRFAHAVLCRWRGYDTSRIGLLTEALRVSLLPREEYCGEIGASLVYRPAAFKAWARRRLGELLPKANGNLVEAMLKFDIYYNRLGDNYAAKVDRMSMSCGLEVRSPFLDYRFMEFAAQIPTEWKLTGKSTKILMKQIIRGIIPDTIIDRQKKGFAGPLGAWVDENADVMIRAVHELAAAGVLSGQWSEFYLKSVFTKNDGLYREYRKRLYFLWKWYCVWMPPTEARVGLVAACGQPAH